MRRFGPLIAVMAIAILTLLARLWDVQIEQHEIWATESANLVRSHAVEPYVRGTIKDRSGRVLVQDEKVYELEFVWRDFRRGHPLGQVAMLRSLALMRPVGLDETQGELRHAALCYASLSPAALDVFATGGELDARIDYVPAIAAESDNDRRDRARAERRRSRAIDLRYYIGRLLNLSPSEAREMTEFIDDEGAEEWPFLDLAGEVTDRSTDEVAETLASRVLQAELQLMRLAGLIDLGEADLDNGQFLNVHRGASPGDRLVQLIERRRREVDDDAADALFRIASGFSARRLSAENLGRFELGWLSAALDWDETRLMEWRGERGRLAVRDAREWLAGHTIARSKIGPGQPADRVLSALAHAFREDADEWTRRNAAPQDWRQVEDLEVLSGLRERLEDPEGFPKDAGEGLFTFQDRRAHVMPAEGTQLLLSVLGPELERAFQVSGMEALEEAAKDREELRTSPRALGLAKRLIKIASEGRGDWSAMDEAAVGEILLAMNDSLQRRVAAVLDVAAAARGDGALARFDEPFIEKAQETRAYVIRDRGARARAIGNEPDMDLVLLVTRYPGAFSGFRVARKTRRVPVLHYPGQTESLASKLVGRVRSPFLVEILSQRPRLEELNSLRRKLRLPEEDEMEILRLSDQMYHPDERVGGSGLEAWFDKELTGVSGYLEELGLQDRIDGNRSAIYRGPRDGKDLTLTLDAALQQAAQDVILHPDMPPREDMKVDERWFQAPVGAICLCTVDGEILAAASAPVESGLEPAPFTDGQRQYAVERTLRRPLAQPPGSVVKPMIALYALQHLNLDPEERFVHCIHESGRPREGAHPKKNTQAGWGQINCNSGAGHSTELSGLALDMNRALLRSCNVYFAALAEKYFDEESMRDAYSLFGFGRPTGVRYREDGVRSGLLDSWWYNARSPLATGEKARQLNEVARQFLGNGLAHIDANVVQVARAYAGLATGKLPRMRLVREIGDEVVMPEAEPLGFSQENLRRIHEALFDVVHHERGTAFKAELREDQLHFELVAKTGSADYKGGKVPRPNQRGALLDEYKDGMRKHTWLAGWFPADEPKYVVVIYIHDTSATAGHSAAYVAKQFLQRAEVQSLVEHGLVGDAR